MLGQGDQVGECLLSGAEDDCVTDVDAVFRREDCFAAGSDMRASRAAEGVWEVTVDQRQLPESGSGGGRGDDLGFTLGSGGDAAAVPRPCRLGGRLGCF